MDFNKAPSLENEPQIKGPAEAMEKEIAAVEEGGSPRKTRLAVGLALMTFLAAFSHEADAADEKAPAEGGIKVEQADPKRGGAPTISGEGLNRQILVAPREGAPEPLPQIDWKDPSNPDNAEALKLLQQYLKK